MKELNQKFPYHRVTADAALEQLGTGRKGLRAEEAAERIKRVSENILEEKGGVHPVLLFLKQFKDMLILILLVAAGVAWLADKMTDVYVIFGVILFNAVIGFVQEYKAEKSIQALRGLIQHQARVIRSGNRQQVPASELAPGDLIELEEGESIPADARVISAKNLRTVEASLTGESMPVTKTTEPLAEDTPLAERENMLWKGTHVAGGAGLAVVTATGANTEIGKIATSLGSMKNTTTNFRKKTNKLGRQMAVIALFTSVVVFVLAYFVRGFELQEILLVSRDGYDRVPAPTVRKKSTVGAGDSMVAGMTYFLARGKSLREMVRFGVACGTAATMTPGTELCRRQDVDRLYKWINTCAQPYARSLEDG